MIANDNNVNSPAVNDTVSKVLCSTVDAGPRRLVGSAVATFDCYVLYSCICGTVEQ